MAFNPITITGVNEAASSPSQLSPAFMRIVLKLSAHAPAAWAEYFNHAWHQHFYMCKRKAQCFGENIEIECPPAELSDEHAPELKKVVDETNAAYAKHVAQEQAAEERRTQQQDAVAAELASVSKKLKF